MIDIKKIKKNDNVWCISQSLEQMIYPLKATFIKLESSKSDKLVLVNFNNKTLCYPLHLLFETELDAKIYGSVNFMKLYYNFDPFFVSENIDEQILKEASYLMNTFEKNNPSKFLYYWMGNVPNRF